MGKFTILFLAACFMGFTISQTYSSKLNTTVVGLIRDQIQLEMQASLFYQTYSHFFENSEQALQGFAKFFAKQSLEEKSHADKLMTYLNQRGNQVKTLSKIDDFCELLKDDTEKEKKKTLCTFITGTITDTDFKPEDPALFALKSAVELEEHVYKKLLGITGDKQMEHFIEHEFLDEQIESIKELNDVKTHLSRLKKNPAGLLMMDLWFLKEKKIEL